MFTILSCINSKLKLSWFCRKWHLDAHWSWLNIFISWKRMKMLGECEMVLYCHLGCNGNNSGPLKSTFGTIFIHSFRTMTIIAFACSCLQCRPGLHGRQNLSTKFLFRFFARKYWTELFWRSSTDFVDRGGICGLRVYREMKNKIWIC